MLEGEEEIIDTIEEAIESSRKREKRRALLQDPTTDDIWGMEYRFRDAFAVVVNALKDDQAHRLGCTGWCGSCEALARAEAIVEGREQ